ncbi:MAG: nucleotidyl transferase AbiEii/AbiGii toxin family protein [Candidatus Eremiobacteraeota bacterium]|nr:nucleotidyl transferase AbiEii/AbiGii toxin family protein [Candidatus Eremiobacteraeota bacterium]
MPTRITEGHFVRHFNGRKNLRDSALLDIAQDHALHLLHAAGLFENALAFKGGTALRKFRSGHEGRFSTDLDFSAAEAGAAELLFSALDGAELDGFRFWIRERAGYSHASLHVETPFGSVKIGSSVDVSLRRPWLATELLKPIALPIHGRYTFTPSITPVLCVEELLAEKLARYRRVRLARDLYDLFWFSNKPFDERLVRRLTYMKVWWDVAKEGRGNRPFDPTEILLDRRANEFRSEQIALLTIPVDILGWLARLRARYQFLREADAIEQGLLGCSLASEPEVIKYIEEVASRASAVYY